MQCGAKCFIVTIEKNNGAIEEVKINARNQILARKVTRNEVLDMYKILTVKEVR